MDRRRVVLVVGGQQGKTRKRERLNAQRTPLPVTVNGASATSPNSRESPPRSRTGLLDSTAQMEAAKDILHQLWSGGLPWLETLLLLGAGCASGIAAAVLVRILLRQTVGRTSPLIADSLREHVTGLLGCLLPLAGIYLVLPSATHLPAADGVRRVLVALLIALVASIIVKLVQVLEDFLSCELQMDVADNLRARKFHTQFRILRRVVSLLIAVLAASAILLQFDGFRQFGRGLLASAGIASIVLGFAAQRTLGNLIAGFQIAITQPIRLDDVVVVEGEWGRIEEITLTYVVVHIWDDRRLILPISYFLEKPFTNWTRKTSRILGTIFLHVDYDVPIDALREELKRITSGDPDWDGRVCEIIAFEARPTTLELRALISAEDASKAWNLRCRVREGLISFLQREYPDALPRFRAEIAQPADAHSLGSLTSG
jgi:small-conductance mechanosensitive channel